MYVHTAVNAHEAAASQPLFSRAVQPAQRKAPFVERRKRQRPAALNLEQVPFPRRSAQKRARVISAPPTHMRVAQAQAGPFHTLHRCIDLRTNEIFFHPEYTGPEGEEKLHTIRWPEDVALPSPAASSDAETEMLDSAGHYHADTTDLSHYKRSDEPQPLAKADGSEQCAAPDGVQSLIERRKRSVLPPLRLDVLPAFKRRNAGQICVLDAPATHVRLHAVQAGPYHMMHQCIDAHTNEIFFHPEYVGPAGQQGAHRVQWPEVINPAAKLPLQHVDKPGL